MKQHLVTLLLIFTSLLMLGCAERKGSTALFQKSTESCTTPLGTFSLELTREKFQPQSYRFKVTALSVTTIQGGFYAAFALANSTPEFAELTRGSIRNNTVVYEDYLSYDDYDRFPLFAVAKVGSASEDIATVSSRYDGTCPMPSNEP